MDRMGEIAPPSRELLLLPAAQRAYAALCGAAMGIVTVMLLPILPTLPHVRVLHGAESQILGGGLFGALVGGGVTALTDYLASQDMASALGRAARAAAIYGLLCGLVLFCADWIHLMLLSHLSADAQAPARCVILGALGATLGASSFALRKVFSQRDDLLYGGGVGLGAGLALGLMVEALLHYRSEQSQLVVYGVAGGVLGSAYSFVADLWKRVEVELHIPATVPMAFLLLPGSNILGPQMQAAVRDREGVVFGEMELVRYARTVVLRNHAPNRALIVHKGQQLIRLASGQQLVLEGDEWIDLGNGKLHVKLLRRAGAGGATRRASAAAMLLVALSALHPKLADAAPARIEIIDEVDSIDFPKVMVKFSVRDERGESVPRVSSQRFKLKEGQESLQAVIKEQDPQSSPPLALLLVLDVSGSMSEPTKREAMWSAARQAIDVLRKKDDKTLTDTVAFVFFNRELKEYRWGSNVEALKGTLQREERALLHLERDDENNGTYLFDAFQRALTIQDFPDHGPQSRLLIVITDGYDTQFKSDSSGRKRKLEELAKLCLEKGGKYPIFFYGIGDETKPGSEELGLQVTDLEALKKACPASGSSEVILLRRKTLKDLRVQLERLIEDHISWYSALFNSPSPCRDGVARTLSITLDGTSQSVQKIYNPGGLVPTCPRSVDPTGPNHEPPPPPERGPATAALALCFIAVFLVTGWSHLQLQRAQPALLPTRAAVPEDPGPLDPPEPEPARQRIRRIARVPSPPATPSTPASADAPSSSARHIVRLSRKERS